MLLREWNAELFHLVECNLADIFINLVKDEINGTENEKKLREAGYTLERVEDFIWDSKAPEELRDLQKTISENYHLFRCAMWLGLIEEVVRRYGSSDFLKALRYTLRKAQVRTTRK